jgi:hypothetical protein
MCQRSVKKTVTFFMNVAESHCYQLVVETTVMISQIRLLPTDQAHHLPGLWAPLTTLSSHGTFSLPSKPGANLIVKGFTSILFPLRNTDRCLVFYFYCCHGMAVAL